MLLTGSVALATSLKWKERCRPPQDNGNPMHASSNGCGGMTSWYSIPQDDGRPGLGHPTIKGAVLKAMM